MTAEVEWQVDGERRTLHAWLFAHARDQHVHESQSAFTVVIIQTEIEGDEIDHRGDHRMGTLDRRTRGQPADCDQPARTQIVVLVEAGLRNTHLVSQPRWAGVATCQVSPHPESDTACRPMTARLRVHRDIADHACIQAGRGMRLLSHLFANNREWAAEMTRLNPEFFARLSRQQAPEYLWIGCADSRVPANQIVGLPPGEMFVHRNVANVVVHTDLNCLSTIHFAVAVLRVRHIIICGHYGCGGVLAALRDEKIGLVDNWLRHVQDVRWKHQDELRRLASEPERHGRLCELNVIEQVVNTSKTTVVRDAWSRGQALAVHGWIYDLRDGLLRDLGICVAGDSELPADTGAVRATGQ